MSRPIWYDSTETGAPTLNNAAGSLLEVLRACLVNGFNLKTVTSITVASGVATATAATHGYSAAYGKLLRIEGAPVAGLNGDVQPLTVDTNTFTYACPGVPDGTYTGTITARRAPLGWIEAFTGTNRAVFKRTAPEANASVLRVFDTKTSPAGDGWATVKMAESASSADTMVNPRPSDNANCTWIKGVPGSTSPQFWTVVGCGRGFYYFGANSVSPAFGGGYSYFFGDIKAYTSGDAHSSMLVCDLSAPSYYGPVFFSQISAHYVPSAPLFDSAVLQRSLNGSVIGRSSTLVGGGARLSGPDNLPVSIGAFPIIGPFHVWDGTNIRGEMPGWYLPSVNIPFAPGSVQEIDGRHFLAVDGSTGYSGLAQPLIDLTGLWY